MFQDEPGHSHIMTKNSAVQCSIFQCSAVQWSNGQRRSMVFGALQCSRVKLSGVSERLQSGEEASKEAFAVSRMWPQINYSVGLL